MDKIAKGALCELARRHFWDYCKIKAGDFYVDGRHHLFELCNTLQEFYESDEHVLVVNLPPRFGKSRTAQLLVEWILGKDQTVKIMTGSYNEMLSIQFAKSVRNSIQEQRADENRIIYSDIFPSVRIKAGEGSMNLWSLEGGHNNYLATSPNASATGFGCQLMIIDDLLKNAKEAYNEIAKDQQWHWFTDTMLSRLETGGKIIVIMTRWATDDLAGRIIERFSEIGRKIRHINLKAKLDDGTMLCPAILSEEDYNFKQKTIDTAIFNANYQQEPVNIKGCLYSGFKTYTKIPVDHRGRALFEKIRAYTDTADSGGDYFCSIAYGVYQNEAYVLDVLYTQEPMEITEPAQAKMLIENNVNVADIESNNGGRGFARNVEAILRNSGHNKCRIQWFHQSENKIARILSNATWCLDHIYFPVNWHDRWREFYEHLHAYQREGKNAHDDAEDALTGVCEQVVGKSRKLNLDTKMINRRYDVTAIYR